MLHFDIPAVSKKRIIIYAVTIILSCLFIIFGRSYALKDSPVLPTSRNMILQATAGKILDSVSHEFDIGGEKAVRTETSFLAVINEGEFKGVFVTALHIDDPFSPYKIRMVEPGDKIFLQYAPQEGEDTAWVLQDYRRTDYLIGLGIFVVLLMLIFGRMKGVHTVISLGFTSLAIFAVFIPAILSGKNIYMLTVVTGAFIIAMTISIIYGLDRKSACAGAGCIFGFLASGIMTVIMDSFLKLTGLIDEDAVLLLYLNPDTPIDLKAIIFAVITIGSLGAVMDVSVSMSSALSEVYQADPLMTSKSIMASGMNIGRDIIGTMANTLMLAYTGSSLSLIILLTAYNTSLAVLMNKEMIIVEVLQSLIGIAGLIMVIPITSLVCAVVFTKNKKSTYPV